MKTSTGPIVLAMLSLNSLLYLSSLSTTGPAALSPGLILACIVLTTLGDSCLFVLWWGRAYHLGLALVLGFLKIGLGIYYREFGHFNFTDRLGLARELTGVWPVIRKDFGPVPILMALITLLLAFYILRAPAREPTGPLSQRRRLALALLLGVILLPAIGQTGIFGHELYSTLVLSPINAQLEGRRLKQDPSYQTIADDLKNRPIQANAFTGLARGKNVIFIQCESLQNTFLNRTYNGQAITPFLNNLARAPGSIYFTDYFELLGGGNTSDAEFVSMSGLYPSLQGQAYTSYKGQSYALPAMAEAQGYDRLAMHGNTGTYYNREAIYPAFHFNHIFLGEDYSQDETINMGLSDGSFFDQSADRLLAQRQTDRPFFALLVTLSTHAPYDLPAKYLTIPKEADDPTDFVYRYANCARYTDNALRAFFAQLEEAGLLEDTLIAVYGDHHAMTLTNPSQMASMTRWLGWTPDYDTMMNIPLILKVPGLEENIIRDNTGSQVDLYPTVLNLLGWDRQQVPTFGIDLLGPPEEVDRNVVFPQTYLVKGSFITKDRLFKYSRDGLFKNSQLINRKTRQQVPTKAARLLSNRAAITLDYADSLMEEDRLEDLLTAPPPAAG
ncbi:LTA synthase family protein [Peptococcus simiae]|uniref:LTA synthase family protein n=1 Tax=Peptococcus simiae TaxID=1643805 RepID=A0ABW9GVX7_9FIRM